MHRSSALALWLCLTAQAGFAAPISCPNLRELAARVEFPLEAVIQNIPEGKVVVSLLVNADGQVAEVKVSSSTHPSFEPAAIKLAQQLRCDPPGTEVRVTLPVNFSNAPPGKPEQSRSSNPRPCSFQSMAAAGFPREAARKGLNGGSVLLEFGLDSEGKVTDVQVLSATDEVFAKAALGAVKDLRCTGVGSERRVKQQFEFRMQ
jgi:TonB family protein